MEILEVFVFVFVFVLVFCGGVVGGLSEKKKDYGCFGLWEIHLVSWMGI